MHFCGNPSRNWLPQLEFNEFHISFQNLRQIFRELCSCARRVFHVWKKRYEKAFVLQSPFSGIGPVVFFHYNYLASENAVYKLMLFFHGNVSVDSFVQWWRSDTGRLAHSVSQHSNTTQNMGAWL